MADWNLIGDIFLCASIIGGIILFTAVNVRYQPKDNKDSHEKR